MPATGSPSAIPAASKIESTLLAIIKGLYQSNDLENLTIKRVRGAAEKKLGLSDGFFGENKIWKERSKEFIKSKTIELDEAPTIGNPGSHSSDLIPQPKKKQDYQRKKTPSLPKSEEGKKISKKRKLAASNHDDKSKEAPSTTAGKSNTNARSPAPEDVQEIADIPLVGATNDSNKRGARSRNVIIDSDDDEAVEVPHEDVSATSDKRREMAGLGLELRKSDVDVSPLKSGLNPEQSDSEMSVLIDDTPPKKRKKSDKVAQSRSSGSAKTSKASKASKATDNGSSDPTEKEMKRLRGWLIKCGIQKFWSKELAPYETPKERIGHLKAMLKDAGMVGPPTPEKARKIRERRELEDDLKNVGDFDSRFGVNGNSSRLRGGSSSALADIGFGDDAGRETD